jgi:hypothetical protein
MKLALIIRCFHLDCMILSKLLWFGIDFVPTDGTRLPMFMSGGFGRSPFFGQLSGKQCV